MAVAVTAAKLHNYTELELTNKQLKKLGIYKAATRKRQTAAA